MSTEHDTTDAATSTADETPLWDDPADVPQAVEPTDDTAEDDDQEAETPEDDDEEESPAHTTAALRKAQREARNLRDRLKDAEARADTATAAVTRLHQNRAEEIATDFGLIDGADLWRYGTTLDDITTDAGGLDPQRVKEAVDALTKDRQHLRRVAWRKRDVEHLTYAQRVRHGVEPAPDAPEEEWAEYRANRYKFGRSGLNGGDGREVATTWFDALRQ